MQKLNLFFLSCIALCLSSCAAIETIFKAGMIWAFFLVALVIVIIVFIARKVGKK